MASLVKKDEFHDDAEALIEAMDSKAIRAHVSTIVPVEVCGAMVRRVGQKEATEVREMILNHWTREGKIEVYDLTEKRMRDAQEIAIRTRIKGMDAIALQLAYELGCRSRPTTRRSKGR